MTSVLSDMRTVRPQGPDLPYHVAEWPTQLVFGNASQLSQGLNPNISKISLSLHIPNTSLGIKHRKWRGELTVFEFFASPPLYLLSTARKSIVRSRTKAYDSQIVGNLRLGARRLRDCLVSCSRLDNRELIMPRLDPPLSWPDVRNDKRDSLGQAKSCLKAMYPAGKGR
jgi:hypothetical protein